MLAEALRRSEYLELIDAIQSVADLVPSPLATSAVIVARLHDIDQELPRLLVAGERRPLVLLGAHARQAARKALRAGAGAMLGLHAGHEQIAAAVMSVYHGLVALPAGAARLLERSGALATPTQPLTLREIEILSLMAGGDSNKTIAARLSISVHTVKFHISSILAKLGVGTRTEAVALGLKLGMVVL